MKAATEEVEALRRENTRLEKLAESYRLDGLADHTENERLHAENTRLREALQREVDRINELVCPECGAGMDIDGDAPAAADWCDCCPDGRKLRDDWTALLVGSATSDSTADCQPPAVETPAVTNSSLQGPEKP